MNAIYGEYEENRIARCIVFYANGDLTRLNNGIKQAKTDWRDTIVTAEYDRNNEKIRDMYKQFTII